MNLTPDLHSSTGFNLALTVVDRRGNCVPPRLLTRSPVGAADRAQAVAAAYRSGLVKPDGRG
jgi:hypothetical protein